MESQSGMESRGPGSSVGVVGGGTKRPYEGSSSESVVSFATDSVSVTQNSVVSSSVANSVLGPDGKRPVKSSVSTTGCRQRITVVCAECKRLKLKCDRRTPCGSCTKRDTIPRCIYSQAAAEKVDVQSLNIRLQAVEGKLSGLQVPSESTVPTAGPSKSRERVSSALSAPSAATGSHSRPRAFLAVGAHGTSVAVSLEGVASLWVDHLGLDTSASTIRTAPATITELDLERLGLTTVRPASGSGIELRPFPSVPSDGVLELIEETVELFRMPASRTTSPETGEAAGPSTDTERDAEHVGEEEEEDTEQVGVSPRLVLRIMPPAPVRAEIYKRFEENHFMCPDVNFFVFKNRIEDMCRWAEVELSKSSTRSAAGTGVGIGSRENVRSDEPHPMTTSFPSGTAMSGRAPTPPVTLAPPTFGFFAAAAFGLALGARCWLIERNVLGRDSTYKSGLSSSAAAGDRAFSPGSSAPGPSTSTYNKSMPLPPPLVSFDNGAACHSTASSSSGPSSAVPGLLTSHNPGEPPLQIDASLPGSLYRLAKFSLNLALDRTGYEAFDTDYIHARCLQVRYLLVSHHGLSEGADLLQSFGVGQRKLKQNGRAHGEGIEAGASTGTGTDTIMEDGSSGPSSSSRRKGKERAPSMGHALALAPEIVGALSDAVGNARMMGLNHDPEMTANGKISLYEIEIRRRLWWEVVILDAFVADCLGESPLINDNSPTTEFPTDVDEESFGPDSANRPAPNIESLHGNIDQFIQRCRLTNLGKRMRRRAVAFRELHPDARAGETRDLLETMKSEIADWLANLPDYLKVTGIPSSHIYVKPVSPSMKKAPNSPAEGDDGVTEESPHLIIERCRLAISARHLFMMLCLAFAKGSKLEAKDGASDDFLGPSVEGSVALMMLEPAIYIVQAWRYLHSVARNANPALFMCYAFTKELFDAAIVLGHLAIEHPLFAGRALLSLRAAAEVIRDPSVLTSRTDEDSGLPSEAVRIVEELILKAEAAAEAANAGLGSGLMSSSTGTPPIVKRKHEEVESASSDLLYHFRFPFVGTGVVSAGPPAASANVASPVTDGGTVAGSRANDSSARSGTANYRSKHGTTTTDSVAATGDPRPAIAKLKSSHPQISVRNRNRKEPSRARANSTTSQRSDVSHMLPPANPPSRPSNSSSHAHGHGHSTHNLPPHRIPSVEPSTPLHGPSSYSGPVATTPGPGPPHYTSPPGSSGGTSSQTASGNEFGSSGFESAGFHDSSSASYGPSFRPQSGPSLPVPSQVGFDGFNIGSSGQGRGSIPMAGDPSSYPFGSTSGIDRPGSVGMHQPSGFDPIAGLPRPPSEPTQDRPFSRNLVEGRSQNRDTDDQMGPPMQSLEHQQSHPHPPQTYHSHAHMQQGWSDYSPWSYYQG